MRVPGSIIPDDMAESVRFHGHVPLGELLEASDTAGMAGPPSYAEGFGRSRPCTPCRRLSHEIHGPEGAARTESSMSHRSAGGPDRPDQIAGSILSLLHDAPLARRLGPRDGPMSSGISPRGDSSRRMKSSIAACVRIPEVADTMTEREHP